MKKKLEKNWRKHRKVNKCRQKSENQKETLANINRIFISRNDFIQLFDDYTTIAFEASYKAL